jgi:hypothetical protein
VSLSAWVCSEMSSLPMFQRDIAGDGDDNDELGTELDLMVASTSCWALVERNVPNEWMLGGCANKGRARSRVPRHFSPLLLVELLFILLYAVCVQGDHNGASKFFYRLELAIFIIIFESVEQKLFLYIYCDIRWPWFGMTQWVHSCPQAHEPMYSHKHHDMLATDRAKGGLAPKVCRGRLTVT